MAAESRLLLILRYLMQETDAEHDVSAADIRAMLAGRGGKAPDRRTIDADIAQIEAAGFAVETVRRQGAPARYRIAERAFDTVELRILIDAVVASRFIRTDRSRTMIRHLAELAPARDRDGLLEALRVLPSVKRAASGTMASADALSRAIVRKRRVRFQMTELRPSDRKPVPRRDGHVYLVSPYAMIWKSDQYYLVAYEEERGIVITPRVDHIRGVEILDMPCLPPPRGFDLGSFYDRSRMFTGEHTSVTLRCANRLVGQMVDRFGPDFTCVPQGADDFCATVRTVVEPTFYGWLLQYGGGITVVGPAAVRERYIDYCRRALESMDAAGGKS